MADKVTQAEQVDWEDVMARWSKPQKLWEKLRPAGRRMRREPSHAEALLWSRLRNREFLGLKFRRQHSIDQFIVDFYCRNAGLVIEVDGRVHEHTVAEDAARSEILTGYGLRVLRFTNDEVETEIDGVLQPIAEALQSAKT